MRDPEAFGAAMGCLAGIMFLALGGVLVLIVRRREVWAWLRQMAEGGFLVLPLATVAGAAALGGVMPLAGVAAWLLCKAIMAGMVRLGWLGKPGPGPGADQEYISTTALVWFGLFFLFKWLLEWLAG